MQASRVVHALTPGSCQHQNDDRRKMAETFLYFTELLALPVYDLKGRRLGRVKDAALVPLIDPARVDRFLVGVPLRVIAPHEERPGWDKGEGHSYTTWQRDGFLWYARPHTLCDQGNDPGLPLATLRMLFRLATGRQ